MLQVKISCFVNAGSLSVMFNLKTVQNGNENDTDGAFNRHKKTVPYDHDHHAPL
jgi:polyisoprenoid-binding protein YceI